MGYGIIVRFQMVVDSKRDVREYNWMLMAIYYMAEVCMQKAVRRLGQSVCDSSAGDQARTACRNTLFPTAAPSF